MFNYLLVDGSIIGMALALLLFLIGNVLCCCAAACIDILAGGCDKFCGAATTCGGADLGIANGEL